MGSFSGGITLYERVHERSLKQRAGHTDPLKSPKNAKGPKNHLDTDLEYLVQLVQDALDSQTSRPPQLPASTAAHSHKGSPGTRALQDRGQRMLPAAPEGLRALSHPYAAFCPYSLQLQRDLHRPLEVDVDGDPAKTSTSLYCPCCAGRLAISPGRLWKMRKPVAVDGRRDNSRVRVFTLTNRFVVKCHRPSEVDGQHDSTYRDRPASSRLLPPTYACCLCLERRQQRSPHGQNTDLSVASFGNMSHLVRHVCDAHSVRELLADPDIQEVEKSER